MPEFFILGKEFSGSPVFPWKGRSVPGGVCRIFPLGFEGIFLCGEGMDLCVVASCKYVLYLRIVLIPFNSLVFYEGDLYQLSDLLIFVHGGISAGMFVLHIGI